MEDFASKVAQKLAEEIGKLARGQKRMSSRQLLKRFGAARRTSQNLALINGALENAGVVCTPSLESVAGLDDPLFLSLAESAVKTPKNEPAAPLKMREIAPETPKVETPKIEAPKPEAAMEKPRRAPLSPQQIIAYAQSATALICVEDGHGSGFVVDRAGLLATARHVVGDAREAEVVFADGSKCVGQVVYSNATLDFAFVRVDPCKIAFKIRGEVEPFPGQRVFAVGSPRDKKLAGSVSAGIVSNTSRVEGGVEYLQTDTSISPGNSGGPLISEEGTVVGMCVWGRTDGPGLNFALPASYLAAAMEWLRPRLAEARNQSYCTNCGHLNGPESWIECRTWVCCGNCGTILAEIEREEGAKK